MARRSKMTLVFYALVALIIAGAVVFFMGPRTPVNTEILFNSEAIGEDIDAYLAREEEKFGDLRPGLQKQIVWAYPNSKAKTPLSIVYVHGFSASSGEVRPLPDIIAADLGANLYYTRLQGHGRTGDAMGEATVQGWLNDVTEAIEIGRRIGEKVILIGTSTGGTLTTWAAAKPRLAADVVGVVNISPNYGVQGFGASMLTIPWARQLVELIAGKRYAFEPANDLHRHNWTYEYPSSALLPMAELVKLSNKAEIHNIQIPALFIYSEKDAIVRPDITKLIAEKWGAKTETVLIENSDDPNQHVIAGDALSPSTTQEMATVITGWINRL